MLLDEIDTNRPVQLSRKGITAVLDTPVTCDPESANAVLKVLKSRNFDFQVFRTEGEMSDNGEVMPFATAMLFFSTVKDMLVSCDLS